MKKNSTLARKILFIPIFSFLAVSVFLLTLSVNVHASTGSSSSLPYFVDNDNFSFGNYSVDDVLTFVNNNSTVPLDFSNYPVIIYPFNDGIDKLTVICGYPGQNTPIYYFDSFSEPYNSFDSSVDHLSFNYTHSCKFVVWVDRGNLRCNRWFDYTYTYTFFGSYYFPSYLNMPLYDNTYINNVFSEGSNLVLTNQIIPIYTQGHATAPNPLNDIDPGSHILPHQVPTLTIYNYTWTTAPTPDLSTLEDAVNSIYDILSWLVNNLIGAFNNLIGNIENIGNYIGATIQYYCGLIYNAIKNGIETFYNNMVSLFEPMFEPIYKIGLFFSSLIALGTAPGTDEFSIPYLAENLFMPEPEDVQEIMEANDSLHIISNLDRIVDKVWTSETSIIKTLHNVTPVKKFHIPSCIYHGVQIGNFDIEFDWFENYKTYSDSIISTFLIIAWIYWFFVSVSHIIRYGQSYDTDDSYQRHNIGF